MRLQAATPLKREAYFALEDLRRANRLARCIGILLFVLIVVNAIVVFFSVQPGLEPIASDIIAWFYRFSTVCFCIEYGFRIWIADIAYSDMTPLRARWRYMHSIMGIIDLLAFFPSLISWFMPVTPALTSSINVLRLVRIVKISRYMRGLRTIGRVFNKRKSEIIASFLVILLLVVVASVLMYECEHDAQPQHFNNIFTGLYWAVETVTSVGYGDLVPITPLGRLTGSIIMLLSVALIAIPGGIFSAGFVAEFHTSDARQALRDQDQEDEEEEPEDEGEGIMGAEDDDDYDDDYDADEDQGNAGDREHVEG